MNDARRYLETQVYGEYDRSFGLKVFMTFAHLGGVLVAARLLGLGGTVVFDVTPGDSVRRGLILGCAGMYLVRTCVTSFYLCERKITWAEGMVSVLETHQRRYGVEFDQYARRTKRLILWIY